MRCDVVEIVREIFESFFRNAIMPLSCLCVKFESPSVFYWFLRYLLRRVGPKLGFFGQNLFFSLVPSNWIEKGQEIKNIRN